MTMSLHDSIVRLEQSLADLDAALDDVILIAGDVPDSHDQPALVAALKDRATGIRDELHAAAAAARVSAIVDAHTAFNAASRRLRLELTTMANVEEIAAIAATRGGSWKRWSEVVRQALDNAAVFCDAVGASLLECWREIVAQYRIPA
jgi:hypothetical protein